MFKTVVSDPFFQMGIFGTMVGTIAVLLAMRSQVEAHPLAVARGTKLVLTLALLGLLLVTGWSGWNALSVQGQKGVVPVAAASTPVTSTSPSVGSTTEPTQEPSPTATPILSRSITQVLTDFCQAISAKQYPTAWSLYATSLQQSHTYATEVSAWNHYTACSIPEQAYDPIALLILTLAAGASDQYGFTGDTMLRFTMGIEAQAWKMTQVCHIIAEGCYALNWG
jgi:hypothetical protein